MTKPQNARTNELGQPIGEPLSDWRAPPAPSGTDLEGRYCRLERLDMDRHAGTLNEAFGADQEGRDWTYLPYGPFDSLASFCNWMAGSCLGEDPLFYALIPLEAGRAAGMASYLRIQPPVGVIEVGHIHLASSLQHSRAATEAMHLMMRHVFEDLGYRRYEWKCDSLNARSRQAALRLGFLFEGIFRQATIYKSRNRDTAWYAIIDRDWPRLDAAYRAWLDPSNFDAAGNQRQRLSDLTAQD